MEKASGQRNNAAKKGTDDSCEYIIFEKFNHKSGKEFECMFSDGMRFYLEDCESKKWQPFPKRWYNEGLIITERIKANKENGDIEQKEQKQSEVAGIRMSGCGSKLQFSSDHDDREGVLNHPERGRISTFIFQRKHNIHCFYDHTQGQWMRLPIGWELHHEMVGKLVDQVEEALPTWGDRQDILALLRQCNYDPDECISTYRYLEGDLWLNPPKTTKEAKTAEEKEETVEKTKLQKEVNEKVEEITFKEKENEEQGAPVMDLEQEQKTDTQLPKSPQVNDEIEENTFNVKENELQGTLEMDFEQEQKTVMQRPKSLQVMEGEELITEQVKEKKRYSAEGAGLKQEKKKDTQKPKSRQMSHEDIIFETFYHKSGKEFQCMYLDGMRFYLDDWGSKEWQPFPKRWYNEGLLNTNSVVKKQENENRRRQQQQQQSSSGAVKSIWLPQAQSSSGQDDREGVLNHPKRGRIPTYIFQRKHNVHCFYDHTQGQWMRLSIGWELHHEMVGKLVDQVEEALPTWGDRQDILALLRQCNYDPDLCISTYRYLEGDAWLKSPKTH
ncbi:uncharacterized protein LOC128157825 [Crassostrea angulata]|uniref:uncharacterized protein LOC128157825 n=1 Tax=Magallana angulata TaxID=2784310 RepID=UPI0022B133F2|nr:uncharacterized protein LOC128157825 [Crassostrea angulata]